jgi:hypothetical protein
MVLDGSYRILRVVGSGGFGITYEAEDINLGTMVAVKEYYPHDFGERAGTMHVQPRSDRHKKTFDWGKANFLEEARTLARFEHISIVRVTRVFEATSTAYMVMRFERGASFEHWLRGLGRLPTQAELDRIVAPLLDALEMLHAADFLHRDIAPDNIIVRADGTPVLLDFGAARRAVAEMSQVMTGIVKAGYSPHEQYSSDSRLQGPWSDIYALGGTLYRAVTGRPPEEAALRVDKDHMPSAVQAARKAGYRPEFLAAIDACLRVRHADRPRSIAQLRPMLSPARPRSPAPAVETENVAAAKPGPAPAVRRGMRPWWAVAAALALVGGALGGVHYTTWEAEQPGRLEAEAMRIKGDQDRQRLADAAAVMQKADEDMQARVRAEIDAKRKAEQAAQAREQADAAKRKLEEDAAARAREEAQAKRDEEQRSAAEEARRKEKEAETLRNAEQERLAAIPDGDKRAVFVRSVQQVLKQNRCYEGAISGRSGDAQEGLDKFVANAQRRGGSTLGRIDLAKASVGDFELWLRDAGAVKGAQCTPPPERKVPVAKAPVARTPERTSQADRPRRAESSSNADQSGGDKKVRCWGGRMATSSIGCRNGTQ